MKTAQLVVTPRESLGRKVKALRREGYVPANIVSHGKESVAVQVEYNVVLKVLHQVGMTQPVILKLGDDEHTVLVTDVKHIPAKNTLEHITFQVVKRGEKMHAQVPLVLIGDAPASQKGLLILQLLDSLEVEAGALSIPEHLDVDISSLEEDGDTVHASTIKLPEGVTMLTDPDAGLVKAEAPRIVEEEPEETELEEGEEGEETADGEEGEKSEKTESSEE